MLSAPSLSHYNSTLGLHWKTKNGTCQTGERQREMFLCPRWQAELPHDRAEGDRRGKHVALFLTICLSTCSTEAQGTRQAAVLQGHRWPCILHRCLVEIFFPCTFLNYFSSVFVLCLNCHILSNKTRFPLCHFAYRYRTFI